jgi:hypothetical protein
MTRKVRATVGQLRRLIEDARGVPPAATGAHLSDDQFVAYSMDPPDLGPEVLAIVEQHLRSCAECADRAELLLSVSEAWRGPAGEQRLAEVSRRIAEGFAEAQRPAAAAAVARAAVAKAVDRVSDWFRQLPQPAAALGAVAGAALECESPAGVDHLSVSTDNDGNLQVAVSSYDLALEGQRVVVEPFGESVTFERVVPDQVGGDAVIPRSARAKVAPGATLGFRIDRGTH